MAHSRVTERDLSEIFKTKNLKNFETVPLSNDKIIGFLGDHFILRIYTDDNFSEFFLKEIPRNNKKRREYIEETGVFKRESDFYQLFAPKLEKFSSFAWGAKCFLVKENDFIILENLKDYKVLKSQQLLLDYDHFMIASKYLASFHASSIIYEEKVKKFSANEIELLKEISYPKEPHRSRAIGFKNGVKILSQLLKFIPKYSKNLKEIQEKFIKLCHQLLNFVEPSKKYRNVLTHGDLWSNNIMFKYDKYDKPCEVKLIDFQLARFSPPAMDLVTFIYVCSTREFRELHQLEILNNYCNVLESELLKNCVELDVLSRSEILKSFEEFKVAGLIEASLFCHLILLPNDLASNIMKSSEEYEKFISQCRAEKCFKAFEENYYKERMTELLIELVDEFVIS